MKTTVRAIKAALQANVSGFKVGDIVVRHDQLTAQGTVVNVVAGVIIFVDWHGRSPSYEHVHDLRQQESPPKPERLARRRHR